VTAIPNEDAAVEALLPCPFCGGPAKMISPMGNWSRDGYGPNGSRIVCADLSCPTCGRAFYGDNQDAEAIAAWNRRAAYPIIAGEGVAAFRDDPEPQFDWNNTDGAARQLYTERHAQWAEREVRRLRAAPPPQPEPAPVRAELIERLNKAADGIAFDVTVGHFNGQLTGTEIEAIHATVRRSVEQRVAAALRAAYPKAGTFARGDRVEKKSGSSWHGVVVGEYSTSLTPEGYCVESEREPGSVQLYPATALRAASPPRELGEES